MLCGMSNVGGWGGFWFMKKLMFVKEKLKTWNKNTFCILKDTNERLCQELQSIDGLVEDDGDNLDDLRFRRTNVMAEMEGVLKAEEMFWYKKAKCKWLSERDGNTKFFH